MAKINISVPDGLLDEIDTVAGRLSMSRSGFLQEASARYIAQVERDEREAERRAAIDGAMERMSQRAEHFRTVGATEVVRRDRDAGHRREDDADE